MGLLNDGFTTQAIDELLRARGYERTYLEGGPCDEPPFTYTERGLRCYISSESDSVPVVLVTRRGTWHLKNDVGGTRARGIGRQHLLRALNAVRAEDKAFETVRHARAIIDAAARRA